MPRRREGHLSAEDARAFVPFLQAARTGLSLSRWRPGDPVDELLAPVVLMVLVAVSRELGIADLNRDAS